MVYWLYYTYGAQYMTGPKPIPVETRFWKHVAKTDTCWLWTAFRLNGRYGTFGIGSETDATKRKVYVHRFAYTLLIGPIPAGMVVCHTCDVPHCVNPAHLFLGTQADNLSDMDAKGRRRAGQGIRHARAKLTAKDAATIRDSDLGTAALAQAYGVHKSTILRVRNGNHWAFRP